MMMRSGRRKATGSGVRQRGDHSRFEAYSNQGLFHCNFPAHSKCSLARKDNSAAQVTRKTLSLQSNWPSGQQNG